MFKKLATTEDLKEYMGLEDGKLPQNVEILLSRASELILISMRNNFNPDNVKHVEVAKLATCSQCQNWIENELSPVSDGIISSYSLGELSVTYRDVEKLSNKLCLTAVRYLNYERLLYKGMEGPRCGCQNI